MPQTRNVCVLAMSRLTEDTVTDMRDGEGSLILSGGLGPDMVMAWAPTEPNEHMPLDLAAPLAWARSKGFEYVIFDRDMDPLDDGCDLVIAGYEPEPEIWQRSMAVGQFYRVNERLSGSDNNGDETHVPAGEVWKLEHLNPAGPGSITLVHPSGVSATYYRGDAKWPIAPVAERVYACNLRAVSLLTATRYIPAASEAEAALAAMKLATTTEGFVWDRSEPANAHYEGLAF